MQSHKIKKSTLIIGNLLGKKVKERYLLKQQIEFDAHGV